MLKVKKSRALNETPSHSYGVSLAIWDHAVLPATRHKWTHPSLFLFTFLTVPPYLVSTVNSKLCSIRPFVAPTPTPQIWWLSSDIARCINLLTYLIPDRQASTWFTYPGGMEGWVGLGDWLHTEMVYPHNIDNKGLHISSNNQKHIVDLLLVITSYIDGPILALQG